MQKDRSESVLASGVAFKRVELKHPARSVVLVGVGVFTIAFLFSLFSNRAVEDGLFAVFLPAFAGGMFGAMGTAVFAGMPVYERVQANAGADRRTRAFRRSAVLARRSPARITDELVEARPFAESFRAYLPFEYGFIVPLGFACIALELSTPESSGVGGVVRTLGLIVGVVCVVVGPIILLVQRRRIRRFLDATAGFEPANDGL